MKPADLVKPVTWVVRYRKYFFLLFLSGLFIFLLDNSYSLIRSKVIDYFNRNQYLLAEQATIGLRDLFLRYSGELEFLANMNRIVLMEDAGRKVLREYLTHAGREAMGITRVDRQGIITFTIPDERSIGRDISYQPHVQYLLRERRPVLSDVFMAVQNFRTVAYHVPVFGQDGEFCGSLALLIDFGGLAKKFIDKIETDENCSAWIMNQNGTILYSKGPGAPPAGLDSSARSRSFAGLIDAMKTARDGIMSFELQAAAGIGKAPVRHWAAFFPLTIENTFWSIAVSTPEPAILKTMVMLNRRWLMLMLILVVAGLVLIYSFIRARALDKEKKIREKLIRDLEWERNFTHKALDSQLDSFLVFDLIQRRAVRWNQRFRDLCSYSDSEIAALDEPFHYHSPPDIVKAEQAVRDTMNKGTGRVELTLIRRDGRKVPVEYYMSSLANDQGQLEYLIAIGRDVSERKEAEAALLASERLGVIGEMAAAVAHDFNNSLQMIQGNLELIGGVESLPGQVREKLQTIKKVTVDAAVRVQMIQRLAGRKGGGSPYVPVDINGLLEEVIAQTRPLWKDSMEKNGRRIVLRTEFAETPTVSGNPGELRTVFHNIIKNSVEAMPEGGEIAIATRCEPGLIRITVRDSGQGMDSQTVQRAFQPFFSTKGYELGRGLGLSGAYSIIREHGGEIRILASQPGSGTCLEITIPCPPAPQAEPAGDTDLVFEAPNLHVLWVDDEEIIRDIGREMVTLLGCRADTASSGQEALERLRRDRYQLVITDVGMPGMNGLVLARNIRAQYGTGLKIAVVTGWGETIVENAQKENSVDFFLQKPVALDQLRALIARASALLS